MRRSLLLVASILLCPAASAQSTWFVDSANSPPGAGTAADPYSSIQFALDQQTTLDGDSLEVAFGDYLESVDFRGKAVTVSGVPDGNSGNYPRIMPPSGSGVTFASGEGPGSVLQRVRVRQGQGTEINGELVGGGILIRSASPVLSDVNVRQSAARRGGGIAVLQGSSPEFHDVKVRACLALVGGGVLVDGSSLVWTNGQLSDNQTPPFPVFSDSERGAGIAVLNGQVELNELTLEHNGLEGNPVEGGGLYADAVSTVLVSGCAFNNNRAARGGGGFGPVEYGGCSFDINHGTSEGGAVYLGVVQDSLLQYNTAPFGGGAAYASLDRCELLGNRALSFGLDVGGGAFQSTLVDCRLRNNGALFGGGMYGGSALRCEFENNVAQSLGGNPTILSLGGGAMAARLEECTFFHNRGLDGGGAWLGIPPSNLPAADPGEAINCTFARNPARPQVDDAAGGALFLGLGAGPVTNCAFVSNVPYDIRAPFGGTVTYSCTESAFPGLGNFVSDPRLVSYQAPDGHLLSSSPCIDAGDPNGPADPDGSVRDIGAFAYDPSYAPAPAQYCGVLSQTGCNGSSVTAQGALFASGPSSVVLTVSGFNGPATGSLLVSLQAAWVTLPSGVLCVQSPRRLLLAGSTPGSGLGDCSDSMDLTLPVASVADLVGEVILVQGLVNIGGTTRLTDAFETAVLP